MITQIEIDGFKTFKDFKVELAPFQVKEYLDSEGLDKARERLEKARATLKER